MLARHRAHGMGLEDNRPYTDGVVTGFGTIDGRRVCVFSQDFTVFGGALGEVYAEKIHKVMDLAASTGVPLIGLNDGGGRPDPGGRRLAARLRRDLPPQRHVVGRHPPDQRDPRTVRRRRRLLPGDDRLHLHGAGHAPHVHHRPRRREDRDGRGRHPRAARRRHEPRHQVRASRPSSRPTRSPASTRCATCSRSCPRTTSRSRPSSPRATTPTASSPSCSTSCPPAQPALRHEAASSRPSSTTASTSSTPPLGHVDHLRLRPHRRPRRRRRRQPAAVLAGVLDIDSSEKAARFVRTCDAFNIPLAHLRRRAGLHARHRPGVRRHHPPRGQAALRVLRVDRAPHPDHHPQGLRRRLRRHELQVDRDRPRVRLALGRAGGDGPERRRRDRLPARAGRGDRPGRAAGRAGRRVHRALRQPLHRGRARLHRRRDRPRRTPARVLCRSLDILASKREELPRRKHGNVPL